MKFTKLLIIFLVLFLSLGAICAADFDNDVALDSTDDSLLVGDSGSDLSVLDDSLLVGDSGSDLSVLDDSSLVNGDSISENTIIRDSNSNIIYVDGSVESSGDGSESNPFKTIQEGIDESGDNYEIIIKSGKYNEHDFNIKKNLTISADGEVIIDGLNNGLIFNNSFGCRLVLNNLIIQDAFQEESTGYYAYSRGSGVLVDYGLVGTGEFEDEYPYEEITISVPSILIANNCIFKSCSAGYGGAIYARGSVVKLNNCHFESNHGYFGVIAIEQSSNLEVENCSFFNNTARYGSVLYTKGANASLNNSKFYQNIAHLGLFYSNSAPFFTIDITRSIIANNSGNCSIGLIEDGKLNITNSVIIDNIVFDDSEYNAFSRFGTQIYDPILDLNDNYWGSNNPDFSNISFRENETLETSSWIVAALSPSSDLTRISGEENSFTTDLNNVEIAIDFTKNNNNENINFIADEYVPDLETDFGILSEITETSNGYSTAILNVNSNGIANISLNGEPLADITVELENDVSLIITVDNITEGENANVEVNLTVKDNSSSEGEISFNNINQSAIGVDSIPAADENSIVIDDNNFSTYFDLEGNIREDALNKDIIFINTLNNKTLYISKALNIYPCLNGGILNNCTMIITEDASNSNISSLIFNNFNMNAIVLNDYVENLSLKYNVINISTDSNSSISINAIYGHTALKNINIIKNIISIKSNLQYVYAISTSGWESSTIAGSSNSKGLNISDNQININSTSIFAAGLYLDSISDSLIKNNSISLAASGNSSNVYGMQIADSAYSDSIAYYYLEGYNPSLGLEAPNNITISENSLYLKGTSMVYGITALSIGKIDQSSSDGYYYKDSKINVLSNTIKIESDKGFYGIALDGASFSLIDNNIIDVSGNHDESLFSYDMIGIGFDAIALIKDSYTLKDSNNINITNNLIKTNLGFINLTEMDERTNNISLIKNNIFFPGILRINTTILVTVDGIDYNITLSNGYGFMEISNLAVGNYTINGTYTGEYGSVTAFTVFEVKEIYHGIIYVSKDGSDYNEGSVDAPVATIAHAIELATMENASFEIIILKGVFYENELNVEYTNLIIRGMGIDETIIDAEFNAGRIFLNYLSDFTLSDVTLRNSINTVESGGAIVNIGNLTLDHVKIANCSSDEYNGGAIYSVGRLFINNSIICDNNASGSGGAIFTAVSSSVLDEDSSLYIFNTLFSNNYAKSSTNFGGGAIYAQLIDGDKQIINCTFKNNRASAGGAILIQQSRGILNIENSTFIENTATGSERYGGGAIALVGETYSASGYASSIKNSIFYNNSYLQSYGYGGAAVFTRHVNLNLTNSILAFNHDEAYNKTVYKFIGGTSMPAVSYTVKLDYNWWGSNNRPTNESNQAISKWMILSVYTEPSDLDGLKEGDRIKILANFDNYATSSGNYSTDEMLPEMDLHYNILVNGDDNSGGLFINEGNNNFVLNYSAMEGLNSIAVMRDNEIQYINFTATESQYKGILYVSNEGSDENDGSKVSPFKTIARALEIAGIVNEDNVTIYVFNGTYHESALIIENSNKAIRFEGESASNVIVDADMQSDSLFVIRNSTVSFENMTFKNVNDAYRGGAIHIASEINREDVFADVTIDNCLFDNLNVSSHGGAIFVNYCLGSLRINNTNFTNLNAGSWGAAISVGYSNDKFNVSIDNSIFANNTANNGILYIRGNNTVINHSIFLDNSVKNSGAIYIYNSSSIIENSIMMNNTAAGDCTAIELDGAGSDNPKLVIRCSVIENNNALDDVLPAIYVSRGIVDVSYSSLVNALSLATRTQVDVYNNPISNGEAIVNYNWWGVNNPLNHVGVDNLDGNGNYFNSVNGTNISLDKWIIMNVVAYTGSSLDIGEIIKGSIDFNHVNTSDGVIEELDLTYDALFGYGNDLTSEEGLVDLSGLEKTFVVDVIPVGGTVDNNPIIIEYKISEGIKNFTYTVDSLDYNYLDLSCDRENLIFRFITSDYKGIIYVSKDGNDLDEGSIDKPVATIKRAIELASASGMPGEIIINEGVYNESGLVINSNLTIGSTGEVVINGNNEGQLIYVNGSLAALKVILKNLTLTGADYLYGAALYNYHSDVELENVNFTANHASSGGTGYSSISVIYNRGNLTISNSTIRDNGEMGLLYNAGNLTLLDCKFINNTALDGGFGLVYLDNSYYSNDRLYIDKCDFINNTDNQGVIYTYYGVVDIFISNSSFVGNRATLGSGGAIHSSSNNLTIVSSLFEDNRANRNGGAIFTEGNTTITDSIFINNKANIAGSDYEGSEIFNDNSGKLNVSSCVILSNITDKGTHFLIYNDGTASSSVDANNNWWGDNEGSLYRVGEGTYTLYSDSIRSPEVEADTWIVMKFYNDEDDVIRVSLNTLNNGESFDGILPARKILFTPEGNFDSAVVDLDESGEFIVVYNGNFAEDRITATIDFQTLVLNYYHYPEIDTIILLDDVHACVNVNNTITAIVRIDHDKISQYPSDIVEGLNLTADLTGNISFFVNGEFIGNAELVSVLNGEFVGNLSVLNGEFVGNLSVLNDTGEFGNSSVYAVASINYLAPGDIGNYSILAIYNGDYNYKKSNATATLFVEEYEFTELTATENNIFAGENYSIKLIDENGNPLDSKEVFVEVYNPANNSYIVRGNFTTDSNGLISFTFPYGNHTLNASFAGDDTYWRSDFIDEISVNRKETLLQIPYSTIYSNEDLVLLLSDGENGFISAREIEISVVDNTGRINNHSLVTDSEGRVYLSLSPGSFAIRGDFNGDDFYLNSSVLSIVTVNDGYVENKTISIRHTGDDARDIQEAIDRANPGDIIDLGDDYDYMNISDINITKDIKIIAGENCSLSIAENSSAFIIASNIAYVALSNLTVIASEASTLISAIAVDGDHASEVAGINVSGNTITLGENVSPSTVGILEITNQGKVFNPSNTIVITNNTFVSGVKPFVLENNWTDEDGNAIIPVANPVQSRFILNEVSAGLGEIIATLVDLNDNPISDVEIVVLINNDENLFVTDEKGQINISGLFGNNLIEISYLGNDSYLGSDLIIDFNSTLTVKKATSLICSNMTTSCVVIERTGEYFTARLTDSDGLALAGKKVQIGFNGKIYERTTNETGGFRLQVNLANAGGYTFAISFLGDENYNASFAVAKITVLKNNATLAISPTSIGKSKTTNVKMTLKLANGTSVSGKTVYLKVNSKTYSAKTDSHGVATVKVTISAKGTYDYSIWYNGDNQINKATKTGKIKVA